MTSSLLCVVQQMLLALATEFQTFTKDIEDTELVSVQGKHSRSALSLNNGGDSPQSELHFQHPTMGGLLE